MSGFSAWLLEEHGLDIVEGKLGQGQFSRYFNDWLSNVVLADAAVQAWLAHELSPEQFAAFEGGNFKLDIRQNDPDAAVDLRLPEGESLSLEALFGSEKSSFTWTKGRAEQTRWYHDTFSVPETDPPVTGPPETDPPETDPPFIDPPETDPPVIDPPTLATSLFFTADDGRTGRELWKLTSDGTVEQVADINPGWRGSSITNFTEFNGALYFIANDGLSGRELWKINDAGEVVQAADINAGAGGSAPSGFTEFNGALYFTADDGITGRELWKINDVGNVAQVADIHEGSGAALTTGVLGGFTEFNGALYFSADDGITGRELWKINDAGEVAQVADINAGAGGSAPASFTEFNGELYFTADDGLTGRELWKLTSDGTVAQVADINPGAGGALSLGAAGCFTEFNGALYFTADDGSTGRELWKIDAAGDVVQIADINTGALGSSPSGFTEFDGELYFSAFGGGASDLWKIDAAGDVVQVMASGPGAIIEPWGFHEFNGALYFKTNDDTIWARGRDIWKIDAEGAAVRVADVYRGDGFAYTLASGFTEFEEALYFGANDGFGGLWKITAEDEVTRVYDTGDATYGFSPSGFTVFSYFDTDFV